MPHRLMPASREPASLLAVERAVSELRRGRLVAVSGGAEGVGRATTRSVVIAITAIIVTDMLFIFILTR
mgnify:CR=1 FL=1